MVLITLTMNGGSLIYSNEVLGKKVVKRVFIRQKRMPPLWLESLRQEV